MPAGRPTLYKSEYVQQAAEMCVRGATIMELAEFFGVDRSTINEWRNVHPEFSTAVMVGKEHADHRVIGSLYERAVGYSHPDVHISAYEGEVTITPIVKHYPPDTGAAFIWAKNRCGWKDKQDVEHSGKVTLEQLVEGSIAPENER